SGLTFFCPDSSWCRCCREMSRRAANWARDCSSASRIAARSCAKVSGPELRLFRKALVEAFSLRALDVLRGVMLATSVLVLVDGFDEREFDGAIIADSVDGPVGDAETNGAMACPLASERFVVEARAAASGFQTHGFD